MACLYLTMAGSLFFPTSVLKVVSPKPRRGIFRSPNRTGYTPAERLQIRLTERTPNKASIGKLLNTPFVTMIRCNLRTCERALE